MKLIEYEVMAHAMQMNEMRRLPVPNGTFGRARDGYQKKYYGVDKKRTSFKKQFANRF